MKDILKVMWKEFRVGLISGAILSLVNFIRLSIMEPDQFYVNITVSISMLCVVVVAKSIGCTLPIFAKKCGFDPAIMAGPFISTIVDVITLLIFFNLANIFIF